MASRSFLGLKIHVGGRRRGYIHAHMANGRAQADMYKVQALLHVYSKSKELWKAMFHLDLV